MAFTMLQIILNANVYVTQDEEILIVAVTRLYLHKFVCKQ